MGFEPSTTYFINEYSTQASLAKWLNICLQTKCCGFESHSCYLKLQLWCLLQALSSLTFRQTIECGFTLKLVRDMIITYSHRFMKLQCRLLFLGFCGNRHPITWKRANLWMSPDILKRLFRW